ncbi:MAG: ABC transporter permease [Burkholderiaceae bacterium]|nr:MAG: ABC transporter permease [Betaproteobacteria bacterium TMED100]|tara:strand:+ start:780 stop:1466 length:687 start_codon:yes stop_codon:yes gene_type:complete
MLDAFLYSINNILSLENELINIIFLTLKVSISSVIIASLIALPIGSLIAISNFRSKKIIVIILNALMGLPPVVVGLIIYLLFSRAGPLGELGILFTPEIMILAQTILVLPIICALTRQIIEDIWQEYQEQLISLGIKKYQATLTLLWDARFSLITVLLAGLGRALSEVGAVLIVGGNIDGVTRVMTTAITLETSKGDLSLALNLGLILIFLIIVLNAIIFAIKELTSS